MGSPHTCIEIEALIQPVLAPFPRQHLHAGNDVDIDGKLKAAAQQRTSVAVFCSHECAHIRTLA